MTHSYCPECNTEFTDEMIDANMCFECGFIIDETLLDDSISDENESTVTMEEITESIIKQEKNRNNLLKEKITQHTITSGYNFEGYKITKYINIVSGQTVIGTGLISELKSNISDTFGSESNALSNKIETAKESALNKLIIKSLSLGGNAVIGVDFDYVTFQNNMIGVSANGTSVIIEEII